MEDIIKLLENQNVIKHTNAVNNERLDTIMRNITGSNIVNTFKNFGPSIKLNLGLAIPLRRVSEITDIGYLNKKEHVYKNIIEYFSLELDKTFNILFQNNQSKTKALIALGFGYWKWLCCLSF